jgi:hypothetical protein
VKGIASVTGENMDNYIVRIYRREKDNPRLLVGLVEEVGLKGKKAFNTLDDLWEILNSQDRDARQAGSKRKREQPR